MIEIRAATAEDRPFLERSTIALQDGERLLHDSRLPGVEIAQRYVDWLFANAVEKDGQLLIARQSFCEAGFVAFWIETEDNVAETPDSNRFGYVSDVYVVPDVRRSGIGKLLLGAAEAHFASRKMRRIRITSLVQNLAAAAAYESCGFAPYEVTYERVLK